MRTGETDGLRWPGAGLLGQQHGPGPGLALGDIGPEDALAVALETVEGDVTGGNIPFQGAPGEIGLGVLGTPLPDSVPKASRCRDTSKIKFH